MQSTKYRSLDKIKKQIDDILSSELYGCKYGIYAHYNAVSGGALFSYRISDGNIQLYINIQTVLTFADCNDWDVNISVCFCAWYVTCYIKILIEWELKKEINTYRDGVIFSEVLYAYFCNKKIKVFVPYVCKKLKQCIKKMRVVDVLCEANTFLRIKAVFADDLGQDESKKIEHIFDERMLYLNAPEVIYVGLKTPSLSLKEVVRNIRLIEKKGVKTGLPILSKQDDKSLIYNLIEAYKDEQDMFWVELLVRMLICSPSNIKNITDDGMLNKIYERIEQYEDYLIDDIKKYESSKERIITDNLTIMLKYVERGKRLLLKSKVIRKSKRTIHINY